MVKKIELIAAPSILAFLIPFIVTIGGVAGPSQEKQLPKDAPREIRQLTPSERRGRAIYLRGESLSGRVITSTIGELEVPASTVNCAGCHGRRAEGKTEGGISAGNLTWGNLTKSYGHAHPNGRKHGPFTEAAFIFAVTHGVDPDQKRLATAMPRYLMAPEDMADLLAYLKHIEFDHDPGLTAESIEIGVPLPARGPLADVGAAMREILIAYFDDLNLRGGIYSRKINLHFTEGGDGSLKPVFASARSLAREGQAFAFVGGLSAGGDQEMAQVASDEEVPFIGPATFLPQTGKPPNRFIFYLQPGAIEQARALVNFADSALGLKNVRAAVLYPEEYLPKAAGTAVLDQASAKGWKGMINSPYESKSFEAVRRALELKEQKIEAVFFFGDGAQTASLLAAAKSLDWKPNFFLLGTLASKELVSQVPTVFKQKIFLAFPSIPADISAEGAAEYRGLLERYKLVPRHTASQFTALAAAKTFVEGLKRAGADLSRDQLVSALEGLYDFETGFMPRLIFGPNRRIGAAGAYMVSIDPETKQFATASGWISAN